MARQPVASNGDQPGPVFLYFFLNSVYHITDAVKQNTFQQLNNAKFFNEESFLKSGEMKNNIYFKMHPSD